MNFSLRYETFFEIFDRIFEGKIFKDEYSRNYSEITEEFEKKSEYKEFVFVLERKCKVKLNTRIFLLIFQLMFEKGSKKKEGRKNNFCLY